MEFNQKENDKKTELLEEIKKRKDVKNITYLLYACIGAGIISFLISLILGLASTSGWAPQIFAGLFVGSMVLCYYVWKKRNILINNIVQMKMADMREKLSELENGEVKDTGAYDFFSDLDEKNSHEVENSKTTAQVMTERKILADKLVSYYKREMLYWFGFCMTIVVLAVMLIFAPILKLGEINLSMFNLIKDGTLLEIFKKESTINAVSLYAFYVGMGFGGIFLFTSGYLLISLPYKLEKLKNGILNPEKKVYFQTYSQEELKEPSLTVKVVCVIMVLVSFAVIHFSLMLMPILFIVDNFELINWMVLAIDIALLAIEIGIFVAIIYFSKENKLETSEARIMHNILNGKGINRKD